MKLRRILAQNLRRLRRERGLSQEALADLAGVNRNYVGLLEREANAASVDILDQLATALEIDPIELLKRPKKTR